MNLSTYNLSIGYHNKTTRKEINFSAKNGDFVCLFGANGTGKSTLMKTFAGLLPIISGEIKLFQENQSGSIQTESSKLISFAFHEKGIENNFTVEEYVSLGRTPHTNWFGKITQKDKDIISESLEKTNTTSLKSRLLSELSEGELQRCIIAKSLAQDTPIILLDETISHLDIPSRINILNLLKKACQEDHKIIILSTHDIEQALPYATHLWMFLADGSNVECSINDNSKTDYLNALFKDISFIDNHFQNQSDKIL